MSILHLLVRSPLEISKFAAAKNVGFPTVAYKMGLDSAGAPYFTQVGATATNSAGRVGIGMLSIIHELARYILTGQ